MARDSFSDEELRQAAKIVVKAMMASVPRSEDCHHEFSPEFLAKMDKLIKKQRRKEAWARNTRRVASFALALLIGASAWLTVDTDARAAFISWVREVYEDSFVYRYFGEKQQETLPDYEISELPGDYAKIVSDNNGETCMQLYQSEESTITLFYYQMQDGWEHIVTDKEPDPNITLTEVFVSGNPADLYQYENGSSAAELVWISDDDGIVFHLTGFLDEATMIQMAESIVPLK